MVLFIKLLTNHTEKHSFNFGMQFSEPTILDVCIYSRDRAQGGIEHSKFVVATGFDTILCRFCEHSRKYC